MCYLCVVSVLKVYVFNLDKLFSGSWIKCTVWNNCTNYNQLLYTADHLICVWHVLVISKGGSIIVRHWVLG